MRPYASVTDLEARFGRGEIALLLDPDAVGSPDPGRLDAAMADASALIDGHLADSYGLPIPDGCPIITRIACDLVRARLADDAPSEAVAEREKAARADLKKIAGGSLPLADASGTPVPRAGTEPSGGARSAPYGTTALDAQLGRLA